MEAIEDLEATAVMVDIVVHMHELLLCGLDTNLDFMELLAKGVSSIVAAGTVERGEPVERKPSSVCGSTRALSCPTDRQRK